MQKHRSTSKFSLQGWVGGLSGKQASNVLRTQALPNVKSGSSHGKCGGQHSGAGGDFTMHSHGKGSNATSVSNEEEKGVHYLDKCVVSQDNECSESSLLTDSSNCDSKAGVIEKPPQKDKPDLFQKIKWGDLDDGTLEMHIRKTARAEIRFGNIGNDNLVSRKAEDANNLISCIPYSTEPGGDKLVLTSVDADHGLRQPVSLSEEYCKEVNEVSSEDVKVQITKEKIVSSSGDLPNNGETSHVQVKSISNDPVDDSGQLGSVANGQAPIVMCEAVNSEVSEIPAVDRLPNSVTIPQYVDSVTPEKSGSEKPGESMGASSFVEPSNEQADRILDNFSNPQVFSGTDAGDMAESKERFRERLWCFLFENLNRAVDELYLLCELECDLEQMKEAILVLEEASSDFKELKSRVEEFENVKGSTSQLIDGPPMTMKSDHRRPHALSWEVSMPASFLCQVNE